MVKHLAGCQQLKAALSRAMIFGFVLPGVEPGCLSAEYFVQSKHKKMTPIT